MVSVALCGWWLVRASVLIVIECRVFFEPSPVDANTTICRSCVHFTPQVLTSSSQALKAHAKDVGYATELVLGVYEKTVGHIYDAVLSSMLNDMKLT